MTPSFPSDLRRFIERTFDSVEELEILLHVHANPDRAWTPDDVAAALRINANSARDRMRALQRKGLLAADPLTPGAYGLATGTDGSRFVGQLAGMYAGWRVAITTIIYDKALPNVQAFADAFDFRKDQED